MAEENMPPSSSRAKGDQNGAQYEMVIVYLCCVY